MKPYGARSGGNSASKRIRMRAAESARIGPTSVSDRIMKATATLKNRGWRDWEIERIADGLYSEDCAQALENAVAQTASEAEATLPGHIVAWIERVERKGYRNVSLLLQVCHAGVKSGLKLSPAEALTLHRMLEQIVREAK